MVFRQQAFYNSSGQEVKPAPKTTYNLTADEARLNIQLYQPRWLVNAFSQFLARGVIEDDVRLTRDLLLTGKAVVHNLADAQTNNAHAVVTYAMIDFGTEQRFFYYDPNIPLPQLGAASYATVISGQYTYGAYDSFYALEPRPIRGNYFIEVQRMFALYFAKQYQKGTSLVAVAASSGTNPRSTLAAINQVDILFQDAQGRRVGIVDGAIINEISGALVEQDGEYQYFVIPQDLLYNVQLTTDQAIKVDVYANMPVTNEIVRSLVYTSLPITPGGDTTFTLGVTNQDTGALSGTEILLPVIDDTAKTDDPSKYECIGIFAAIEEMRRIFKGHNA